MLRLLKKILIVTSFFAVSCINDLSFYDDSKSESKANGLLIGDYRYSKPIIIVEDKKYKIIEAWTSYKFKHRGSTDAYKDIFAFTFILEDTKKNREPDFGLINLIECTNKDVLFEKKVGIIDSQFRVFFKQASIDKVDTIRFILRTDRKICDSIMFVKK